MPDPLPSDEVRRRARSLIEEGWLPVAGAAWITRSRDNAVAVVDANVVEAMHSMQVKDEGLLQLLRRWVGEAGARADRPAAWSA